MILISIKEYFFSLEAIQRLYGQCRSTIQSRYSSVILFILEKKVCSVVIKMQNWRLEIVVGQQEMCIRDSPYTDLLSDIKILGENMYFQNSVVKVLKNKIFKRYIGWKSFYIFFVSKLFLKKKYKVISGFLYCLYYIKNILC